MFEITTEKQMLRRLREIASAAITMSAVRNDFECPFEDLDCVWYDPETKLVTVAFNGDGEDIPIERAADAVASTWLEDFRHMLEDGEITDEQMEAAVYAAEAEYQQEVGG